LLIFYALAPGCAPLSDSSNAIATLPAATAAQQQQQQQHRQEATQQLQQT